MPKVSVIVPIYNVEKYLNRCIDSILNQTFTDFELILVDDGSPDRSGKICDEYAEKDDRVKVIHKQNGGVSAARNTGIDEAVGEYIMFVDSDDYIDSMMLQVMFSEKSEDVILSGLKYVDMDGNLIKEYKENEFSAIGQNLFIEEYYIDMNKKCILNGPYNKLFKRSIIKENNIKFNESISICEDGLFVVNFLQHCKTFSNINEAYYNYVQYAQGSLMSKYNANAFNACELLYNAKIKFININNKKDILKSEIDNEILRLFISFFSQIYSRSDMNFADKYNAAKNAIKNKTFKMLLNNSNENKPKIKLMKIAIKLKCIFLIHILYNFHWRKLKG